MGSTPVGTPTPTPSASATPSSTPSAAPTLAPSPTSVPTASPTPVQTPTPTPTTAPLPDRVELNSQRIGKAPASVDRKVFTSNLKWILPRDVSVIAGQESKTIAELSFRKKGKDFIRCTYSEEGSKKNTADKRIRLQKCQGGLKAGSEFAASELKFRIHPESVAKPGKTTHLQIAIKRKQN